MDGTKKPGDGALPRLRHQALSKQLLFVAHLEDIKFQIIGVVCRPQDPGNVGTILRTLDAFDADGLLLTGGCADPYGWKAVRSSMGAVFRRPIYSGTPEELAALIEASKNGQMAPAMTEKEETGDEEI